MTLGQILLSLYSCMIISAMFSLGCRFLRPSLLLKKCVLALECTLFFIGVPILFTVTNYSSLQVSLIINFCFLCVILIHFIQNIITFFEWVIQKKHSPFANAPHWRVIVKTILTRTAIGALILSALLLFLRPADFLSPLQRPGWLLTVLLYSIISAPPQEYIYRKFFFDRYRLLFPSERAMLLASSAAFSFMHIIFRSPVPLLLTFAAGYLFALSYTRYQSLLLPIIEHAVYGSLTFTLGYHSYFYYV